MHHAENATSAHASSGIHCRTPDAKIAMPTMAATIVGTRNDRRRLSIDALRQAMTGPMPVSASRSSPIDPLISL